MEKLTEQKVYDKLLEIVDTEIDFLSKEVVEARPDPKEYGTRIGALFDLAKIYATLKDDVRNDKKAGLL